ncbi:MAG: phosphomethylpyrimidine synthase [Lentisphaerae bacterium RIFOXYC12_FULL_60_16]|nr:MAG: phosphomethylpyrimidine synthase [Lentisphaerae bacterium RIFOXYC12_FULL_60_16]OGV73659.1 MAG: phosphomethylpyrimidine synthase [Lentisphaerae bacterium RIFOXYA12_FULL_60_10]OGV85586.1 MAG: phosphomethylpyrimidine synthase [Lentisphaerae bacterium RIFOXYB12_FULL_60_10]
MPTQMESAQSGILTPAMHAAAASEHMDVNIIRADLAAGHAVIPANPGHANLKPAVIGRRYRTKINANIGRSPTCSSLDSETAKLSVALAAGTDCVMDLSVGPDLTTLRHTLLSACPVPFGTVPVYEALQRVDGNVERLSAELLLDVVREQAEQGVDFMTLHAGIRNHHIGLAKKRKMGIVSRGGAILAEWMLHHQCDNPYYSRWDDFMAICRQHDVTVSLGDGLRPGCLADASDEAQFAELDVLGELVKRCRAQGVQCMVEGPGHVPLNQIAMNMQREDQVCAGAPFYVLGPIVTDAAPGYDHITAAIGATIAATHGACLLCYVTPAEHLGLPTSDEVRTGIIAFRIAAHAADIARGLPNEQDRDNRLSDARMAMDWETVFNLSLDPETARNRYQATRDLTVTENDHCSMCGKDFCAVRRSQRLARM